MFKKLFITAALMISAVTGATYSPKAEALAPGFYAVSVCGIPNPRECPGGANPVWVGPYPTIESCRAALAVWSQGYLGMWPRTFVSDCLSI